VLEKEASENIDYAWVVRMLKEQIQDMASWAYYKIEDTKGENNERWARYYKGYLDSLHDVLDELDALLETAEHFVNE